MKFYFFDTSALVKRYHKEGGTDVIDRIFESDDGVVVISSLSIVEAISAFKRKVSIREITRNDLNVFISKFFSDVLKDFLVLELNEKHIPRAIKLVTERDLRTLDSLQLSIAIDLKDVDSVFVCSDSDLCTVAKREGLNVINPTIQF